MAKFSAKGDDAPPKWLKPYMGKAWKAWTMSRWHDVLVKEGMIRGRVAQSEDATGSNPGS